jgi:hypothetical protein
MALASRGCLAWVVARQSLGTGSARHDATLASAERLELSCVVPSAARTTSASTSELDSERAYRLGLRLTVDRDREVPYSLTHLTLSRYLRRPALRIVAADQVPASFLCGGRWFSGLRSDRDHDDHGSTEHGISQLRRAAPANLGGDVLPSTLAASPKALQRYRRARRCPCRIDVRPRLFPSRNHDH